MKKAIIVNNYFYNQETLDYIKQYVDNTLDTLEDIYYRLGGIDNCEVLTEEEMIAIYNFIDLFRNYEIVEINK